MGRARLRLPHAFDIAEQRIPAAEVEGELTRLRTAIQAARQEMRDLQARLHGALTSDVGEFLDLHALLLDDPELLYGLDELIRAQRYTAGYALRLQRNRLAAVFQDMDDAYLKSRIDDLDHVIDRIQVHLYSRPTNTEGVAGEILVSNTVAPSELAQLQAQGVVAVVTSTGNTLSHSAILARSLGMPLIVGCATALTKINDGDVLIADGDHGVVVVEPTAAELRDYHKSVKDAAREKRELIRLLKKSTHTQDGVDIALYANAESREDAAKAHELGAAGIGLYRTEFLFLQRKELPTEEEQFHAYRDVVLGMSGRPVTIRTLDLGADKADRTGLALRGEDNPALGLRGVRLSLAHGNLFDAQLRAILRASGYGPVRILVPMVTMREELQQVRKRLKRASEQLREAGHEIAAEVPLGAMIEVPSAAISMENVIDLIDFASVGTNDLVQYLLATDRNNDALGDLYSPLHPALLRLLDMVFRVGREHNKQITVCGEIAGDPAMVPILLALGLENFSLHPSSMLELRRTIRGYNHKALLQSSAALLKARDRAGIERWLKRINA